MTLDRLHKQVEFIVEIDKVKSIFRQTILIDGSRRENDAEHSWHLAVMAVLLAEHVDIEINVTHVIKMVLIHDLVEIYAGDTYCYDEEAAKDKRKRELEAADKIFNLLPSDQAEHFRTVWEEFEECITPEARYAAALDRLQPLLHNYLTNGRSWIENNISKEQVLKRSEQIKGISQSLWEYAKSIIAASVEKGFLRK